MINTQTHPCRRTKKSVDQFDTSERTARSVLSLHGVRRRGVLAAARVSTKKVLTSKPY
jgi:hypothetical protein